MYKETLYLRKKAPKPEGFSPYTKGSMQLLYFSMFNINFTHKMGKNEHREFLKTNPPLSKVYSIEYLGDD